MTLRWCFIIVGMIVYWITESVWFPILGVAVFLAVGHAVYHVYRKEDPVSAEIAFYSETDGYHSSDADGDGDGGD